MTAEETQEEIIRLRVMANKLRSMGNLMGAMDVAGQASAMERELNGHRED